MPLYAYQSLLQERSFPINLQLFIQFNDYCHWLTHSAVLDGIALTY